MGNWEEELSGVENWSSPALEGGRDRSSGLWVWVHLGRILRGCGDVGFGIGGWVLCLAALTDRAGFGIWDVGFCDWAGLCLTSQNMRGDLGFEVWGWLLHGRQST